MRHDPGAPAIQQHTTTGTASGHPCRLRSPYSRKTKKISQNKAKTGPFRPPVFAELAERSPTAAATSAAAAAAASRCILLAFLTLLTPSFRIVIPCFIKYFGIHISSVASIVSTATLTNFSYLLRLTLTILIVVDIFGVEVSVSFRHRINEPYPALTIGLLRRYLRSALCR